VHLGCDILRCDSEEVMINVLFAEQLMLQSRKENISSVHHGQEQASTSQNPEQDAN
jgi:hypothetical protein